MIRDTDPPSLISAQLCSHTSILKIGNLPLLLQCQPCFSVSLMYECTGGGVSECVRGGVSDVCERLCE